MPLSAELVEKIEANDPKFTKIVIDDPSFGEQDVNRLRELLDLNNNITWISIKKNGLQPGQYSSLLDLVSFCPSIKIFTCQLSLCIAASMLNEALGPILEARRNPDPSVATSFQNEINRNRWRR